jgi:hypothetical protein
MHLVQTSKEIPRRQGMTEQDEVINAAKCGRTLTRAFSSKCWQQLIEMIWKGWMPVIYLKGLLKRGPFARDGR